MNKYDPFTATDALDDILLDVATLIELSPRDRKIAENRYRLLKTHIEREGSPLAPYLIDDESLIYAQGSIATSTTIISGTDDDRFDVDAIVEIDVPAEWDDSKALDVLEESLQGFPGATKIVRCTRCVQIQFPFMHMDVAIMDRGARIAIDRAGEIFHSPDEGPAYRVDSNPWGFTNWFRSNVLPNVARFSESINKRREVLARDKLQPLHEMEATLLAKAEQQELPPAIPSRIDAQEAVALKLLKRNINISYDGSKHKPAPSIYMTKRAGEVGYVEQGLSAQLYVLADSTAKILRDHIAQGTVPEDVNPSYPPDRITDRWPGKGDDAKRNMEQFAGTLEHVCDRLNDMAAASLSEISEIIDELFGERIGQEQRRVLKERFDRRDTTAPILSEPRTGGVRAPAVVVSRPERPELHEVREHRFHPFVLGAEDDE